MKSKKIISLLLAALMVLAALSMTFISAFAEEETIQVAEAVAPATLPNGKYYTKSDVFKDGYVFNYTTNNKNNGGNWMGDIFASTAEKDLTSADGMMLKVDASNIQEGTNTLSFRFDFQVVGPNAPKFYVSSNVGAAWKNSGATKDTNAKSDWYISKDGADWTLVNASNDYMPTGIKGGGVYYIYIPFSSMYTRYGETYLKTGTNVSTENHVPFDRAREVMGGVKTVNNIVVYISGNTEINNVGISEFQFVYGTTTEAPVYPTYEIPVIGKSVMKPFLNAESLRPNWTKASDFFLSTAKADFLNATGVMFEIDTTNVSTTDAPQFNFILAANTPLGGNGNNNYFNATAGLAASHLNAKVPDDAISTWYWSEDGVNWTALRSGANTKFMTLPAKHTKAYVYVPFDSFWSRYDADYISGKADAFDATKLSLQYDDYLAAMGGDNFEFTYIHGYYGKGTASQEVQLSNWSFVDAHVWDNGAVTTEPTHTTEGVKTYTCATCAGTKTEVVAKTTEHDGWDDGVVTTEPTHTAEGVKTYTCTCGETKTEEIPKLPDHAYTSLEKVDANQHKAICECDDFVMVAHTWDEGVVTTAPTHTAEGVKTYTCMCGETKTEVIEKVADHEWLPAPGSGCGEMWQYSCFDCGATKTEMMEGEHSFAPNTPYTDCDADGHMRICQNCANKVYEAHTWNDGVVTTEPTATEDGVKTYTCECGETKTEAIPAIGTPDEPADEPTTDDPATDAPATDDDAADSTFVDEALNKVKGMLGCSGVISSTAVVTILTLGLGVAVIRKKED